MTVTEQRGSLVRAIVDSWDVGVVPAPEADLSSLVGEGHTLGDDREKPSPSEVGDMKRAMVDRGVGLALIIVTFASVLIVGLFLGEGWRAVGVAVWILITSVFAGWSAERWARQRDRTGPAEA